MPWAIASAVLLGLLVARAGAGWRGGAVIGVLGLLFAGFALVTSVPRCPTCGASLARLRSEWLAERPGGPAPTRERRCPRCRVPFE